MRFSIAVSALFAGLAIASPAVTDTLYSTEIDTITSCAASVTDCPARLSTSTSAVLTSTITSSVATAAAINTVAPAVSAVTVTVT